MTLAHMYAFGAPPTNNTLQSTALASIIAARVRKAACMQAGRE